MLRARIGQFVFGVEISIAPAAVHDLFHEALGLGLDPIVRKVCKQFR